MADFSLAREAYADLEDIDRYTLETWGEEQRIAYVTGLFDQFETIAGNPGLGGRGTISTKECSAFRTSAT